MRWKSRIGGLALLLATVGGCKQRLFIASDDYQYYQSQLPSAMMENDPKAVDCAVTVPIGAPTTVLDPERPVRDLSLAECIAIALEQGTVGQQSFAQQFINSQTSTNELISYNDQPIVFSGRGTSGADGIRVLRLDPASVGAGIEASLTKFDALWTTSLNWNTTDRPVGTSTDTFTAGASSTINTEAATLNSSVLKPLPTGGLAGITFSNSYTLTNLPARVNPSYQPSVQFAFEQPLLQGYGVEIEQLRPSLPGSLLFPGVFVNGQPTAEGILVTRIRFDQQRAEFERVVNIMLFNVEYAYWNLYNSYWQLYSAEQGLRQAYETWKISMASFQAGRIAISDLAQAKGQYEQFRGQRLLALNGLLENERQLRGMLGMPAEDCTRLVPSDSPTLAPYQPDWCTSLQEALANRPELVMAREDVKANQMNVILQKNSVLPDLRFTATYDVNDIGSRLDGVSPTGALHNLGDDHFNNWAIGLRYTVPIGNRLANANLRIARLQLARSYEVLVDQELKVQRYLALQYRRIITNYELIKVRRAQRDAFAEQLKARFQEFLAGRQGVTLDRLLEAQRFWADALATEYVAVRDYNNSIVGWELGKGTILTRNNVIISEGPLPDAAVRRADAHQEERAKAILLRERAMPVVPVGVEQGSPSLQPPTPDQNLSLMDLWKKDPPLRDPKPLPPIEQAIHAGLLPAKAEVPASSSGLKPGAPVPIPTISTTGSVKQASYQLAPTVSTSGNTSLKGAKYEEAPAVSTSAYNTRPSGLGEAKQGSEFGDLRPIQDSNSRPSETELLAPPPPIPGGIK